MGNDSLIDMTYTSRTQISDLQRLSENSDPSLAQTSECLKNLQEAERARAKKSKVAEAAAANLLGNGVLSQPRNDIQK